MSTFRKSCLLLLGLVIGATAGAAANNDKASPRRGPFDAKAREIFARVISIPTSLGQEDHVSMGATAATKAWQIMANAETVLAIEQMCAAQALDFRAPVEPGCLLELNVGFVQKRARVCKFWGKASVEGKVTCEVQFTAMVADPPS